MARAASNGLVQTNMKDINILTVETARGVILATLGLTVSERTLRRWANRGWHGGFRARTNGRLLFRTAVLKRTVKPGGGPLIIVR